MFRPVVLAFALALLWHPSAGRADSIPIVETACGPDWLCYGTGPQTLTTTIDVPSRAWTLTPVHPPDPDNWRLQSVQASVNGSFDFGFVYANPGSFGVASQVNVAFIDSTGRELLNAQGSLDSNCFVAAVGAFAGMWNCTGGDGLVAGASFGAVGDFFPLDPMLPSLDGPITLRMQWSVSTSEPPEFSVMNVNSVEFSYIFVPVPEPSTALLVAAGMGVLAGVQRGRRRKTGLVGAFGLLDDL